MRFGSNAVQSVYGALRMVSNYTPRIHTHTHTIVLMVNYDSDIASRRVLGTKGTPDGGTY